MFSLACQPSFLDILPLYLPLQKDHYGLAESTFQTTTCCIATRGAVTMLLRARVNELRQHRRTSYS